MIKKKIFKYLETFNAIVLHIKVSYSQLSTEKLNTSYCFSKKHPQILLLLDSTKHLLGISQVQPVI